MKKTIILGMIASCLLLAGCASEKTPSLPVSISHINVDRRPHTLAAGIQDDTMLVSCFGSGDVVAFSLANHTVEKKYEVRKGPAALIQDKQNQAVYCLHTHENAIAIFGGDPLRVKRKLGTGSVSLAGGAVHPGRNEVWICDGISGLAVLQTPYLKLKKRIQLGRYPQQVAFSRDGKQAYVTLKGENAVAVVDTTTYEKIAQIPVGIYPKDIVVSGNTACISNYGSHDISLIDIVKHTEITKIKVRKNPNALSVHKNTLWVACERSYRIMAIDISQAKLIGSVKVGFYPGDVMALKNGELIVAAPKNNRVAIVALQDNIALIR